MTQTYLVLHSACAWPTVHAETSKMPEGPEGAEHGTALPGFHCSFFAIPYRKGQDSISFVTPTSSLAQPGFTTLSASYKNRQDDFRLEMFLYYMYKSIPNTT